MSDFITLTKSVGKLGEQIAKQYLIKKGYDFIEANFSCNIGEIDLILKNQEFLVFVEVKTRKYSHLEIDPLISLTQKKRRKLLNLGKLYLLQKKINYLQPRFDFVGVIIQKDENFIVKHIPHAFV